MLFILTVNALLLAVMGTFQKLAGAPGLYFGLQPSPNEAFFATFIYHNHWGAFILLSTAAALGLLFHYARRTDHRRAAALARAGRPGRHAFPGGRGAVEHLAFLHACWSWRS